LAALKFLFSQDIKAFKQNMLKQAPQKQYLVTTML